MAATGLKILVAIDEGEESSYALTWCLNNLLSHSNSEHTLILLYVKTPPPILAAMDPTGNTYSSSIITSMERYASEVAVRLIEKATGLCKELNDRVKVETMVENGDPREVICGVAERLKVDFLVLGSHGYGPIKRAFLGSVSNHCAHNVKCPVLIVKKPK